MWFTEGTHIKRINSLNLSVIILGQLRCNASFLNYDLGEVIVLSNAFCICAAQCGNAHPFIFDCDKYIDNRGILNNDWLLMR